MSGRCPMSSFTVKLSEHKQLRAMLKVLGYRRTTARIVIASRAELNGRYWDEGSRNVYTVCDIVPMKLTRVPQCAPPQFGGPTESQFHDILPGQCYTVGETMLIRLTPTDTRCSI